MENEVIELLKSGRDRIADPKNWTKGYYARDAGGNPIGEDSPEAVCWCAAGALQSCLVIIAAGNIRRNYNIRNHALEFLHLSMPSDFDVNLFSIAGFNDAPETTHADVMAAYDRAIALAEKSE